MCRPTPWRTHFAQLAIESVFGEGHRGIEWIVKPGGRGHVLIAVNADRHPVEDSITGLERFRSCRALFETRKVWLSGGRLHEAFGPFDVDVYRLLEG